MFFDNWTALGRIALTALFAYAGVILFLRLMGKRTLAKWNAFDFIVTIALGSTLASTILAKDAAVLEGLLALILLMGLQFVATWFSVRSATVRQLLKSQPTLLLYQGELRPQAMRRERVTTSEVLAALRGHGIGGVESVAAVVLETDGSFTVIDEFDVDNPSAFADVAGFEADLDGEPSDKRTLSQMRDS